jgi:hypothetical protein
MYGINEMLETLRTEVDPYVNVPAAVLGIDE